MNSNPFWYYDYPLYFIVYHPIIDLFVYKYNHKCVCLARDYSTDNFCAKKQFHSNETLVRVLIFN